MPTKNLLDNKSKINISINKNMRDVEDIWLNGKCIYKKEDDVNTITTQSNDINVQRLFNLK